MEKRKPHYALEEIKRLIREGRWNITLAARGTANRDFGFTEPPHILDVVLKLGVREFYKSMTQYRDHRFWQDVYHKRIGAKTAYVKVQIADDRTVVISFKEK